MAVNPLRILLLNPNTSNIMTERMHAQLALHLAPETIILDATAASGVPVVADQPSFEIAAITAVDTYRCVDFAHDIVVLGCFGDPGLAALREIAPVPVIGLAESSILHAIKRGKKFAIITIGFAWIPILNAIAQTFSDTEFIGSFAMNGTGLDVFRNEENIVDKINQISNQATEKGAELLILGGSALAGFKRKLSPDRCYLDGIEVAAQFILNSIEIY